MLLCWEWGMTRKLDIEVVTISQHNSSVSLSAISWRNIETFLANLHNQTMIFHLTERKKELMFINKVTLIISKTNKTNIKVIKRITRREKAFRELIERRKGKINKQWSRTKWKNQSYFKEKEKSLDRCGVGRK